VDSVVLTEGFSILLMRYENNFGNNFTGAMIIQLQEAMIISLFGGPSSCLCHRLKVADIAISTWCCAMVFVPLVVHVPSSTCCASAGRCWTDDPTAQTFHLVTSVCLTLSRKQWRAIDLDWVTVSRPWCLQWFQQQYREFVVEVMTYCMVCR
jgi:hypothetical protein